MENWIKFGKFREKEVEVNRENTINGHMLLTGASGTGKTNLLKVIADQITDDFVVLLDFSGSFKGFASTECVQAFSESTLHDFCKDVQVEQLSAIASSIQAAYRFGASQKAAIMKALNKMNKKRYLQYEISPECKEGAFFDFLTFEDDAAVKSWALLAFILDTECGASGAIIAARLLELVSLLYKKEKVETQKEGVLLVEFPRENGSGVSEMVELYLWSLWKEQVQIYEEKIKRTVTIVIDECQVLNWKKGSIAEKILSEGRKFGISLLLSTQFTRNNFPQRVITSFMQSGVRAVFQPPESDLKEIAQSMEPFAWSGWVKKLRNLPRGNCIVCGVVRIGERVSRQMVHIKVRKYDETGNQ